MAERSTVWKLDKEDLSFQTFTLKLEKNKNNSPQENFREKPVLKLAAILYLQVFRSRSHHSCLFCCCRRLLLPRGFPPVQLWDDHILHSWDITVSFRAENIRSTFQRQPDGEFAPDAFIIRITPCMAGSAFVVQKKLKLTTARFGIKLFCCSLVCRMFVPHYLFRGFAVFVRGKVRIQFFILFFFSRSQGLQQKLRRGHGNPYANARDTWK